MSESRQLKIHVDAQVFLAFKAVCKESGISMAKDISGYMGGRIGATKRSPMQKSPFRIATRRERRAAIRSIVSMLDAVRDAEEAYACNIPENLKGGSAYEEAECAAGTMDEAIALLNEVYG